MYLAMTGSRLKGEDAFIAGLANYYIPRDKLEDSFEDIKKALVSSDDPKKTIAEILDKYHKAPSRRSLPYEIEINQIFGLKDFRKIFKTLA